MASTIKDRLQAVLSREVASPADAERAQEAARVLGELLALEERAANLIDGATPRAQASLAGLALHEAAERVLAAAGTPLHARELGARIKAGGWQHPRSKRARRDQIVFQLAARLPRYPQFRRIAPNTFALAAWEREPPTATRAAPRLGLFESGGAITGERLDDSVEHVGGEHEWRSS